MIEELEDIVMGSFSSKRSNDDVLGERGTGDVPRRTRSMCGITTSRSSTECLFVPVAITDLSNVIKSIVVCLRYDAIFTQGKSERDNCQYPHGFLMLFPQAGGSMPCDLS